MEGPVIILSLTSWVVLGRRLLDDRCCTPKGDPMFKMRQPPPTGLGFGCTLGSVLFVTLSAKDSLLSGLALAGVARSFGSPALRDSWPREHRRG
jgi:hypothetical protein